MNKQNKNPCHSDSANKIKTHLSALKLTYLGYLKEQLAKDLQQFHKLTSDSEIANEEVVKGEQMGQRSVTSITTESKKTNIFKEIFKWQTANPVDDDFIWIESPPKANAVKENSFRKRLRKYFLVKPQQVANKSQQEVESYAIDDLAVIESAQEHPLQKAKSHDKLKESLIDFTAGSIAGIAQVYVSQPLDTVKVKLQTFPKLYKNMFKCFLYTYQRNGIIRGLYAGSVPAVIASVAENSVLFTAYGACQKFVAFLMEINKVDELSALGNACAGFLSAFFTTFALCPAELVKCKLQAVHEMKNYIVKHGRTTTITAHKITKDIFVNEGISGFYRGLSSTFVREMPGFFLFFGGYEATRELLTQPHQTKEDIGPLRTMCAGAVGGISLWTFTFPADVIKSRIQINNLQDSMSSVALDILRKEGILAFYNGLLPTILRTIPAAGTLFLVYEYSKKILTNK